MTRDRALREIAARIADVERPHAIRVAVDGVGASGKTRFADGLAEAVAADGRQTLRVSIDGFHNPAEVRRRRGSLSPRGYYEDSFDYEAFIGCVLRPLGPRGDGRVRRAVYDFRTDAGVDAPEENVPEGAVLLCDGIFLMRPELDRYWDFRIFLDVDFEVALERAVQRDLELFGTREAVRARYRARYIPGEQHYLDVVDPAGRADVVVDNNDFLNPGVRWCSKGIGEEAA